MTKRLIGVASSFGYGPVSKLLAVAKPLKTLGYDLCFVGRGPALELAQHFPFDRVLAWQDAGDRRDIERELEKAEGIVNVMEPRFGDLARPPSLPHFYIDSLFWMWSRLDPRTAHADIYFIQNFVGVQAQVDRWRAEMRNPQIVGPVVDISGSPPAPPARARPPALVINFGGLASGSMRQGQELAYPGILLRLLLPILNRVAGRYEKITFTGNRKVMAYLDQQFPQRAPNIYFTHLSHKAFLTLLRSARCLLTSPGLTTTYEAFLLNVPVRFLPPQNYSQTLMLDHYRQAGLSDYALHWKDIYAGYDVGRGSEVSTAVRTILATIEAFAGDLPAQERAAEILRQAVNEPIRPTLGLRQAEFARSMGRPAPASIARRIDAYLERTPPRSARR